MLKKFKYLFMTALLVLGLCQNASGELAAVGPVNSTNGFSFWYMDENGLALELCLTLGGCVFDAPIVGNSFSQQIGFGEKAFYWSADADLTGAPGAIGSLTMALVASFSGSTSVPIPLNGEQITFFQIAVGPITGLTAGSVYRVIHPYGVIENLVADPSGVIPKQRQDIGCAMASTGNPCDFTAALRSSIGPFLKWDPAIAPAAPAGFIGNPATAHPVIGSPWGTNVFRIEGPNAGGAAVNFKETNLFKVQGKLFTGSVPTPLIVDRSTYNRPIATHIEVIVNATSSPTATLQVSGAGLIPTTMTHDGAGKFYARIPVSILPDSIIVTANDPPKTATTAKSELIDVVTISSAGYNPGTSTLTIEANSSDALATLATIGFGNLIDGKLVVLLLAPSVPPAQVTVISSAGGGATAQVNVMAKPKAIDDRGLSTRITPVPINLLQNDLIFGIGNAKDPATVNIVTPPVKGTAVADPVTGEVTYAPTGPFVQPLEKDTFTYTFRDNFNQESNAATVTVNVVESETVTVTKAQFTRRSKWWQISGKSTVKGLGNIITIYLGPTASGTVIGTVTVNAFGSWSFSRINSPIDPGVVTSISVKSALGTEVLNFPITFR